MKNYISILLSVILLNSCKQKDQKQALFTNNQFKTSIKDSFKDQGFLALGEFKSHKVNSYVIRSNHKLIDSLIWENKIFYINVEDKEFERQQLIKAKISYPSKTTATVKVEYSPGYSNKLIETLNYEYKNNSWVLKDQGYSILDGKFD